MDKFFFEDINHVWMKQIKRTPINPDEVADVNTISMILINEFSSNIHNVTNRIIYKELTKRPKASLHQQLLIKRQIINNVSENIISITINMAKEKLDIIKTEAETPIVEQILEPVLMSCDNFDIIMNSNNSFTSFLDDEYSMQVDYPNNTNEEEQVNII